MASVSSPVRLDVLPAEIILDILQEGGLSIEDVRAMYVTSSRFHSIIKTKFPSINRSLCVPHLDWHSPTIPSMLISSSPSRTSISSSGLQFSLEFRERKTITQEIFKSNIMCACSCEFLFIASHTGGCCHCRNKVIVPVKKAYLSVLWRLGDCYGGRAWNSTATKAKTCLFLTSARLAVLRDTSVDDLACLFIGQYMVGQSFWHRDFHRRRSIENSSLKASNDFDSSTEIISEAAFKSNLDDEEGNMNERMCAFRELALRHGPWVLDAYFNRRKERDEVIKDWVTAEVKRIQAWEAGALLPFMSGNDLQVESPKTVGDVEKEERDVMEEGLQDENNANYDDASPSFNLRICDVLAEKLHMAKDDIWQEICRIVWDVIERFKAEEAERASREGLSVMDLSSMSGHRH